MNDFKFTLGIETSSKAGSVALAANGAVMKSESLGDGAVHAGRLMPCIDNMLYDCGIGKRDVDLVAVSIGPGSFTGLRVGVTCAKTLAYALGWAAVGVCSLEVLAQNIDPADVPGDYICPLRDARRGAVYGRLFAKGSGGWEEENGEVMIDAPHRLAERLPENTFVFGSGMDAYPEVFGAAGFRRAADNGAVSAARAAAVAELGIRIARTCGAMAPAALNPRYYRRTEVEERLCS